MSDFYHFKASDKPLFDAYQHLKFLVFVQEFGWPLKYIDQRVCKDAFDDQSGFFATVGHGQMTAGFRYTRFSDTPPYAELFQSFIGELTLVPEATAVITGFAAIKPERGIATHQVDNSRVTTRAAALFTQASQELKLRGIEHFLLSAGYQRSQKAFSRWGFKPVSQPLKLPGAPIPIINMYQKI